MSIDEKKWYKLDAFSKTYSSIIRTGRTTTFRLSCSFYKDVDKKVLANVLDSLKMKYPFFYVELKKGFFWNYLEYVDKPIKIEKEITYPCSDVRKNRPIRIFYFKNKISIEIAHFISDGLGILPFFQDIIENYICITESLNKNVLESKEYNYSNLFEKFYKKVNHDIELKKAYHFPYKIEEKGIYNVTSGYVDTLELKQISKKYNTTISKLLLSVYFKVILDEIKRNNNEIVISVPVDLRQIFQEDTRRNFFVNIAPSLDPKAGNYTLEEIIEYINNYFAISINKKHFYKILSKAISSEKNILLRIVPYFLKRIFLPNIFDYYSERGYTTGFSNLGVINFDKSIEKYIDKFVFIPPPSKRCKIKIGLLGFKDKTIISFGNLTNNFNIEKEYFSYLRKEFGIKTKIETNR